MNFVNAFIVTAVIVQLTGCAKSPLDQKAQQFTDMVRPEMTSDQVASIYLSVFSPEKSMAGTMYDIDRKGETNTLSVPNTIPKLHPANESVIRRYCFELLRCEPQEIFKNGELTNLEELSGYLEQHIIGPTAFEPERSIYLSVLYDPSDLRVVAVIRSGLR